MKSPSYYSPYSNNAIYEFDPILDLDTGDLNAVATGYAVHLSKDVAFSLQLTDRQSNVLNSPSALLENPFVRRLDIDILDISGEVAIDRYISGSFENSFVFTEQENINADLDFNTYSSPLEPTYSPNFGVGISIVGEGATNHSVKYFVYANPLEIGEIYVSDQSGLWLNNNPIQFQSYVPYETSGESINGQLVTNNALYLKEYKDRVSGYSAEISGSVAFAILSGESLKIDWGSGQINTIFAQTGTSGFSGIAGVTDSATETEDSLLDILISPTGINGRSYNFATGYIYDQTGIYDVNFYYSGIGSTGDELIKTVQYRIPDELQNQGKPQLGDAVSGKIEFNIQIQNNPLYTQAEKFEIYASTGSGIFDISNESGLSKVIPIFSNTRSQSFYLDQNSISAETPYWFKIVPFSKIGSGYAWEVGPYSFYYPPLPKTNVSSESFSLINGDSQVDMDLLTGAVETSFVTTIDTLPKGNKYSYEYSAQFRDASGHYCSSKIVIVDNTSGMDSSRTGVSFEEYSRSQFSFVDYSISGDNDNIYLSAQINNPTGFYKLYKTSI